MRQVESAPPNVSPFPDVTITPVGGHYAAQGWGGVEHYPSPNTQPATVGMMAREGTTSGTVPVSGPMAVPYTPYTNSGSYYQNSQGSAYAVGYSGGSTLPSYNQSPNPSVTVTALPSSAPGGSEAPKQ